jgi:non-ribosomal peptide synthetase component E (peptide arylation enzyme)
MEGRQAPMSLRSGRFLCSLRPQVQAAAVVAMPHARLGETVCAYVIARPSASVDAAGINALLDAAGVARQKYPERYFFVDAFPSTASGKVKKDLLRKDALERSRS